MNRRSIFQGALAIVACTSFVSTANASSHREAPAISRDPAADNTDTWAWAEKGTHDKLNVVACYNPLEEPSGGPNFHEFSDDVLYEIHVTRGKSLADQVTFQIEFNSTGFPSTDPGDLKAPVGGGKEFFSQLSGNQQTYQIKRIDRFGRLRNVPVTMTNNAKIAPINIGPRTNAVAYGIPAGKTYDDAFAATFIQNFEAKDLKNRPLGRSFAGPRDDGFYVDLGGVFDLANLRGKGVAQDGVSGFNAHCIALEVPTYSLVPENLLDSNGTSVSAFKNDDEHIDRVLGVWASASRRKVTTIRANGLRDAAGAWQQVSRLGLPLVNEALIGLQDKDKFNASRPATDVGNFGAYFLSPVAVRDAEAVGIYAALGVPQSTVDALKSNRLDIINAINIGLPIPLEGTGDVLRVDLTADSGFPNGRSLDPKDNCPGAPADCKVEQDVTDVLLSVILSKGTIAVKDNVDYNDKPYLSSFPYLALPWEGYSQGHGKATP